MEGEATAELSISMHLTVMKIENATATTTRSELVTTARNIFT